MPTSSAPANECLEIFAVYPILRSIRVLHPDERAGAGHGNHDAPEIDPLDVCHRVRVGQTAGLPHQIDDDLVRDAHDDVVPDIVIGHVSPGVIGQDGKRPGFSV